MDVIFLGTGAGAPTRKRNVSSIALRFDQSREVWLFDCGEGTQHQFQRSPVSSSQVTHVFLTHLHGDHVFGLPGFLSSRSLQGGTQSPLTIIGPLGVQELIHTTLKLSQTNLSFPLQFIEIVENGLVLNDAVAKVECATLVHPIKSFGYAINLSDTSGRFMIEKAIAAGIPSGPIYGQLKQGHDVQLHDGRNICGKDFIEPATKGKKIAILGDTSPCNSAIQLAKDADLLIHEATFASEESKLATISGHSTNIDAAKTALEANAKALILTHISARYDDTKASTMLVEAQQIFTHTHMAADLLQYYV
jgi:ribonuclease Z